VETILLSAFVIFNRSLRVRPELAPVSTNGSFLPVQDFLQAKYLAAQPTISKWMCAINSIDVLTKRREFNNVNKRTNGFSLDQDGRRIIWLRSRFLFLSNWFCMKLCI